MANPTPRMRTASSGGSRVGRYPIRGAAPRKPKEEKGPLGFVENLGEDLGRAIVGLPAGVVETVRNPVKVAKGVAKSYEETYGHGPGQFFHEFYEHPLGPVLDALTVASLGIGSVAKAGQVAAKAGTVAETSRLARLGQPAEITLRSPRALYQGAGPTAVRRTSKRPLRKAQQKATDRFLRIFDAETPIIGEFARYGREFDKLARSDALALKAGMTEYLRSMGKLKPVERDALHMIARGVSPRDYQRFLKLNPNQKLPRAMIAALENPDMQRLWEQPSARMVKAYEQLANLGELDATLKIAQGRLTEETAAARPSLHREIVGNVVGQLDEPPVAPTYVPDRSVGVRVANTDFARMGGGVGVAQATGGVNRGILLRAGQLALEPDLLGPEWLKDVKYGLFDDIHSSLLDAGVRLPKGEPVPEGWMFLRRKVIFTDEGVPVIVERGPGQASERIGHIEKTRGEHDRDLRDLMDEENEAMIIDRRDFATDVEDLAESEFDYRIIVPKNLVDQVAGEFKRSSKAMRWLVEKPLTVWRALVLGARVGFLTNNVTGNHLLYALRFAGPAGIRAYLNMLKATRGSDTVRRVLHSKGTPPGVTRQFMEEFFPEQTSLGTFIGTQVPGGKLGTTSKVLSGGLQIADRAIEAGLRRAAVEAGLRKTPRVRELLKQMPRETRSFQAAARKALDEDPQLAREVSGLVNDALGNYLSLTAFERNAVRAVFPFYAWFRAITTIAVKMPLEIPGRANLLANIGEVGADMIEGELGELPSYLRDVIPLGDAGGDRETVLATRFMNPLTTVEQIGQAGAAAVSRDPAELGRRAGPLLNPFIQSLVEQGTGKTLLTGGEPLDTVLPGLLGAAVEQPARNLPQVRLFAEPSALYPNRGLREQILSYLGVPIREVDLGEARRRARQER